MMWLYMLKIQKNAQKKSLKPVSECRKVSGYKVNPQKSIVFLFSSMNNKNLK